MLASVAAGFDIRIANTSAIHPQVPGAMLDQQVHPVMRKKEAFIGQRRDAYFSAVRDSFIEPENSFNDEEQAPNINNTYHGITNHYRSSINFEITGPAQKKTVYDECKRANSIGSMTPSSDDNFGCTTASVSGLSSSIEDLHCDGGNTSLSMSYDSAGNECGRPVPTADYPRRGSRSAISNPSDELSQLNCANISGVIHKEVSVTNLFISPPKQVADERICGMSKMPVRPDTLNITPHVCGPSGERTVNSKVLQTSSSKLPPASSSSYPCSRSVTSPGSTPPHIEHPRLLLDIDMDSREPVTSGSVLV